MPPYNPYFFQTLSETRRLTPEALAGQLDKLLLLFGGFTLHAAGVLGPPAVSGATCKVYTDRMAEGLENGRWSRSAAEALLLLLLKDGLRELTQLDEHEVKRLGCNQLYAKLAGRGTFPHKMLYDLKRGYVLSLEEDPQACRPWNKGEAVLTSLAASTAEAVSEAMISANMTASIYLVAGAVIYTLGVLTRITPAYHLVAISAGFAKNELKEPCEREASTLIELLADRLLNTNTGAFIVKRLREAAGIGNERRVAYLLAAEAGVLCRAVKLLGAVQLGPAILAESAKRFGLSLEYLDPSMYLRDIGVLGVPSSSIKEEVEACLARCTRTRG